MARKIDHAARRREIAEKALGLFSHVGYDNVSLIMIAAASGVSRTALYQYFCSKREVMDAAIKYVTDRIAANCLAIVGGRESEVAKLQKACHVVVEEMYANHDFLVAVFDFVVGMVRTGADMNLRIAEFTAGTRGIIRRLVEHGKRRGEFAEILDVDRTTDVIYSEFESCAMRIVLGREKKPDAAKVRFSDIIRAIAAWR